MNDLTDFNLGWAVGLFEGEGSITIRPPRTTNREKTFKVQLQIASTDEDA
jgi:hypothetical protein